MGSEHSVVTALAELGRMEQERVEGERRQAARRKVQALEQELARQATERFERELGQVRARLQAEHEAHTQELAERLTALQVQLAAAEASRDTLRAALAAHAQPSTRASRSAPLLLAALACALAALALISHLRSSAPAPGSAVPALTHPSAAVMRAPNTAAALPASMPQPRAAISAAASRAPAATAARATAKPVAARRGPRPERGGDVLADLDRCSDDDPTCGLDIGD